MNYERYEDWVRVSIRWIKDFERDQGLPHHIQILGIEDAELHDIGKHHLFDDDDKPLQDEYGILLLERWQIRAHLWVLGAYELTRMLAQRVRENPLITTDIANAKIQETKLLFERVRIPLAKLEPSRKNKLTDFPVALPGIGADGLAWKVSDDQIITQRELSDNLWGMLSSIWPRENQDSTQENVDRD